MVGGARARPPRWTLRHCFLEAARRRDRRCGGGTRRAAAPDALPELAAELQDAPPVGASARERAELAGVVHPVIELLSGVAPSDVEPAAGADCAVRRGRVDDPAGLVLSGARIGE